MRQVFRSADAADFDLEHEGGVVSGQSRRGPI
jgi:hypothetical protein